MNAHLDVRFSFLLRATRSNKAGKSPIVLRVRFRGERSDVFTGLYCSLKDWDPKSGLLKRSSKDASVFNPNLEQIKRKAINVFDELRFQQEDFSLQELVEKIKGKEKSPELLLNFLQEGNQKMLKRIGVEITKATYYKYKKSLEYTQEFLFHQYKANNYLLIRVDLNFLDHYFHFLRTNKNISHSCAIKYLSFLKVVLGPAIRSGKQLGTIL
jgi:hypothetical protein